MANLGFVGLGAMGSQVVDRLLGKGHSVTGYIETPMDQACVDENLVTAPAWPAHPAWLSAFLEVLNKAAIPAAA